jgi:hypothetical protein
MRIQLAPHTPVGNHTVTIVGTSGTFRRTTTINLRVQNLAPGRFNLTTSNLSLDINAGSTVKTEIRAEPTGGFNAPVTFSVVSELPDHIQATFNPRTISVPGTTTLSVQVPATVPPQEFNMTVRGDGGGKQETLIFTISTFETIAGDFSVRITPTAQTIYTGELASYEIAADGWDGFNEIIFLETDAFPNFLQANFQPQSIRIGEKAILSIPTTVDTPISEISFFVTARAQKTSKKIPLTLSIIQEKGDFSFNFPPNFLVSMTAGTEKTFSFQPSFSVNWNAPIHFKVLNLPSHIQADINPAILTPEDVKQGVSITFTAFQTAPNETYSLSLQGSGGGKIRTVHFRLQVLSIQDGFVSLELSPNFPQIKRNHDTPLEITLINAKEISYVEFVFRWNPILVKISSIELASMVQNPSTGASMVHEINQQKGEALIKISIPSDNALNGDFFLVRLLMSGINSGESLLSIEDTIARNKNLDLVASKGSSVNALVTLYLPGDVNGDGKVDIEDLVLFARAFGSKKGDSNYDPRADFNNDGVVDGLDLILLAYNWGLSI